MNISTMRIFRPFTLNADGRCILASPEAWREPLEWQEFEYALRASGVPLNPRYEHNVLVQPDPFAELTGRLLDSDGLRSCSVYRFMERLFAIIDSCNLMTFWLPTRHPERAWSIWPTVPDGTESGECDEKYMPNVRIGLYDGEPRVVLQANRTISRFCGGLFVLKADGEVEVLG